MSKEKTIERIKDNIKLEKLAIRYYLQKLKVDQLGIDRVSVKTHLDRLNNLEYLFYGQIRYFVKFEEYRLIRA